MIDASGIRKRYGTLEVLKGVDLHVAKGEIVSIVGASGAGKTTVFQLLPEFTALENVLMPGLIAGKSQNECRPRAEELLTRLNVIARKEHKPSQLSGGEQQRVAVARALFNSPSVVLADEPSGNLDSAHARELHQLFFDLRKELGQTFVIVTHNEELANMADRKLTIKDGVI